MENNNMIIIIVAVIVVIVAAVGGAIALGAINLNFNSGAQVDENLVNAYNAQVNMSDKMFEMESVDYDSSSEISKAIREVESWKKDNDKTKQFLETARTQATNDTDKQYINLLLDQNKMNDRILTLMTGLYKDMKKYNNGTLDATQLATSLTDFQSKLVTLSDSMTKNLEDIKDLLSENPELEDRLKTLGIKGKFIGETE